MWFILIVVIIIWRIVHLFQNWKLLKLSRKLKTDFICLPIIGHAYKFIGNDEDRMNAFQSLGRDALKHDGIISCWVGQLHICVADPVVAECLLKRFLDKSDVLQKLILSVIGNGLIFAPVHIWRPRRKILTTFFSTRRLNELVDIFIEQSNIMIEQLKTKTSAGPFSVWYYITTYTMDTIFESALGMKMNSQMNHNHPFVKTFEISSELMATRLCSPWQHNDTIFKLFPAYYTLQKSKEFGENFMDNIIKSQKIKQLHKYNNIKDTHATRSKTILETIIEASGGEKGYTDVELREEMTVIVLAGTDTSAVVTANILLLLARHQDVQEKVHNELIGVFRDFKGPITAKDLPRLQYLEAVIKESMRLYPPVPILNRQCDEDFTLPSGVTLVKGCSIVVNVWALHRNPKYWGDDAEEFRPERFLDTPFKHPAQFMPFSYGPRNCVAMHYAMRSMKVNLATLLRRYRVLPDVPLTPGGEHKPLRFKFDLLMKDVDKYVIQIQDRHTKKGMERTFAPLYRSPLFPA